MMVEDHVWQSGGRDLQENYPTNNNQCKKVRRLKLFIDPLRRLARKLFSVGAVGKFLPWHSSRDKVRELKPFSEPVRRMDRSLFSVKAVEIFFSLERYEDVEVRDENCTRFSVKSKKW